MKFISLFAGVGGFDLGMERAGHEWKATGKVAKQADGPRYKQMGNAVTVNVAAWFGGRLANVEEVEGKFQGE